MSTRKPKKPEWAPDDAGEGFASSVIPGVIPGTRGAGRTKYAQKSASNRSLSRGLPKVDEYVHGVMVGDRTMLARAITLIESNAENHQDIAQEVLTKLLPYTGDSFRVGISGIPGAGKSTFIEAAGARLTDRGEKVAVLAIDPSSSITKGSILGDKTRMQNLSANPNCFIRPSPSGGVLGGVARKSRETILLCEAAGFRTVLVETIGVGQNELTVRSMVDMFVLVMIAGAGDELQAIKKGALELADLVLVNKADGEMKRLAESARREYDNALHYLQPPTRGWSTRAATCSAITGDGITEILKLFDEFRSAVHANGTFDERRSLQLSEWFTSMVDEQVRKDFYKNPKVAGLIPQLLRKITNGEIPPAAAARTVLEASRSGPVTRT